MRIPGNEASPTEINPAATSYRRVALTTFVSSKKPNPAQTLIFIHQALICSSDIISLVA